MEGLNKGEGAFYGQNSNTCYAATAAIGNAAPCRSISTCRAGSARLYRRAFQDHAGDDPPRDVRFAGALHRHHDRALRRAFAAVAVAAAGREIATITSDADDFRRGEAIAAARRAGLRVEGDLRNEKINYKVREHSLAKVPVLLVVGRKEAAERTVSIRRLGREGQQVMPLDAALAMLAQEAVPPDVARMKQAA